MDASSLTDSQFLSQCQLNATFDPVMCPCMLSGGGPELNTDISGPGVRISFYLQALFLGLLSVFSGKRDDIANSLYTLMVTNVAMVVASCILGFGNNPSMSLQDTLVVIYLLAISWTCAFLSLLRSANIISGPGFGILYVTQSYAIFAYVCAVLIKARSFGQTYRCNTNAVVFIFHAFRVFNAGRILAIVILAIVFILYTLITILDYSLWKPGRYKAFWCWMEDQFASFETEDVEEIKTEGVKRELERERHMLRIPTDTEQALRERMANGATGNVKEKDEELTRPFSIRGVNILQVGIILIFWSISLANTERLIVENRFDGGGDGLSSNLWGFGQILPMFLVVLPLVNLLKVVAELIRTRGRRWRRIHRLQVAIKTYEAPEGTPGLGSNPDYSARTQPREQGRWNDQRFPNTSSSRRGTQDERSRPRGWFSFNNRFSGTNDSWTGASTSGDQPAAHISQISIQLSEHSILESNGGQHANEGSGRSRTMPGRSNSTFSQLSYVTAVSDGV